MGSLKTLGAMMVVTPIIIVVIAAAPSWWAVCVFFAVISGVLCMATGLYLLLET